MELDDWLQVSCSSAEIEANTVEVDGSSAEVDSGWVEVKSNATATGLIRQFMVRHREHRDMG